jgi:hypothetical protein
MEIVTLGEARENGLKRYFTGKPCKHGHVAERLVSTKGCVECAKATRKRYALQIKRIQATWYQNNKDKVKEQTTEWVKKNREKVNEKSRRWIRNNPEKHKEIQTRAEEKRRDQRSFERAERRKDDLGYLLKERYRDRILKAVKNNCSEKAYKTAELLGCTVPEFIDHLKKTMKEGMTWEKFMESDAIHLDHIKPIASFDLNSSEEQLKCFHYTNYQLLWKKENLSKGAKYKGVNYRYI